MWYIERVFYAEASILSQVACQDAWNSDDRREATYTSADMRTVSPEAEPPALRGASFDALVAEIMRRGAPPVSLHDRALPAGLTIRPGRAEVLYRGQPMQLRPRAIEVLCRLADVYPSSWSRDALALVSWPDELTAAMRVRNLRVVIWEINRQARRVAGDDLVMTSYRARRVCGSCWLHLCDADRATPASQEVA